MIVVDTNILIYRVVRGPRNEEAEMLARLDPGWAAPLLWRSELRNVLSGLLRRGTLTPASALQVTREAHRSLLAGDHAVEDQTVFDLVRRSKCTSYDCEFVALALVLNIFLVTEDAALLRAFPEHCRSLRDAVAGNL